MRLIVVILATALFATPLSAQTVPTPIVPTPIVPTPTVPTPTVPTPTAPPAAAPPAATAPPPRTTPPRTTPQQRRAEMEQRFDAANTTRDGRLTLAQAKAAQLHVVVRNFPTIDRGNKGYVTKPDLETYMRTRRSQQMPN